MDRVIDTVFAVFFHIFNDPWKPEDEQEIKCEYRFRKPSRAELNRFTKEVNKSAATAQQNLIVNTIHDEDKDRLLNDLENHPGLLVSISSWLLKGTGLSGDLGN